jgi:hypothetical protein
MLLRGQRWKDNEPNNICSWQLANLIELHSQLVYVIRVSNFHLYSNRMTTPSKALIDSFINPPIYRGSSTLYLLPSQVPADRGGFAKMTKTSAHLRSNRNSSPAPSRALCSNCIQYLRDFDNALHSTASIWNSCTSVGSSWQLLELIRLIGGGFRIVRIRIKSSEVSTEWCLCCAIFQVVVDVIASCIVHSCLALLQRKSTKPGLPLGCSIVALGTSIVVASWRLFA